jgi:biotin carboxyl carrier protein
LNIEELKELLEFVAERNIAELELEEGGTKLKIRKARRPSAEARRRALKFRRAPRRRTVARGPAPKTASSISTSPW